MNTLPRRHVLAGLLAGASVSSSRALAEDAPHAPESPTSTDSSPRASVVTVTEDLMREHGVLNRLMLVYDAALSLQASRTGSLHEVLHGTASLIRSFVEDYHGTLEERFVFPEFDRQGTHTKLVQSLRDQHRVGRMLTGVVLRHATADGLADDARRGEVAQACRDFIRMFRAHAAWEDTELFPAFKELVSADRLRELGGQFEEIEHRHFGRDGFSVVLEHVVQLERHVGIQGLDVFMPSDRDRSAP